MSEANPIKEIQDFIREQLKEMQEEKEAWQEILKNPEKAQIYMQYFLPIMQNRLMMIFLTHSTTLTVLDKVIDTVDMLPNHEEFNNIKSLMHNQDKKVSETLLPIKEEIERIQKSRDKALDYIG